MESCAQCGFDYASVAAEALPARLLAFPPRYATALRTAPDPRRRPAPEVWSPLEYTCHVRDVFDVQRTRLHLALRADRPEFAPMGREERAAAYAVEDPEAVLAGLTAAADALAAAFAGLRGAQWERAGVYPWPERRERSMVWLGRHTVHEGEHHLLDITTPGPPGQ